MPTIGLLHKMPKCSSLFPSNQRIFQHFLSFHASLYSFISLFFKKYECLAVFMAHGSKHPEMHEFYIFPKKFTPHKSEALPRPTRSWCYAQLASTYTSHTVPQSSGCLQARVPFPTPNAFALAVAWSGDSGWIRTKRIARGLEISLGFGGAIGGGEWAGHGGCHGGAGAGQEGVR